MDAPMSGAQGVFAEWQPRYAEHGIATFPIEIVGNDKKPATIGYSKTGLRSSGKLALKFADAVALACMCGPRNRVTVLDLDDTDETIIKEGEALFGRSPLLWRTGGGKFAMPFRYNGETRLIRPIPGLPIDLLGGGVAVLPPSAGVRRPYEIIEGTLADLDRLPVARIPGEIARKLARDPKTAGRDPAERIPEGRRNGELFKYCRSIVGYCDNLDQLIDAAKTYRDDRFELLPPVPDAEVVKTCNSVWRYQGGRRKIMHRIVERPQFEALAADPEILGVFAYLAAENGPDAEFMIADGLAQSRGWPRRLVPNARKRMLELGLIEPLGRRGKTGPYLYRWIILP
jgi:hypothetical protein